MVCIDGELRRTTVPAASYSSVIITAPHPEVVGMVFTNGSNSGSEPGPVKASTNGAQLYSHRPQNRPVRIRDRSDLHQFR